MQSTGVVCLFLLAVFCTQQVLAVYLPPVDSSEDKGGKKSDVGYGIVIDMGSKGSRVSIFVWPSSAAEPYAEVSFGGGDTPWYSKITPGAATFAANPEGAGPYLKPLLDFAASNVPSDKYRTTPIFIHGTDDMRQLPFGQAEQILDAISNYTATNYKFLMTPNCVSLLPGILEGSFMWVAANYLQENFQHDEGTTIGTLDMGSGSTQIAFIPKAGTAIPNNYYYTFAYGKDQYTPYVHSYTGYGYINSLYTINSTIAQSSTGNVIYNPCMLAGYNTSYTQAAKAITMHGTGSWAQCSALTYAFLNASGVCDQHPCSFDGAYQPSLHGNFVAVSNYVDIESFLGYSGYATVQNIIDGGVKFCALTWQEALEQYPSVAPSDLSTYCFGANYLSNLLGKGYGFDASTTINFSKTYESSPYTWALGAMIYELQIGW